jgi:hypothetical protein
LFADDPVADLDATAQRITGRRISIGWRGRMRFTVVCAAPACTLRVQDCSPGIIPRVISPTAELQDGSADAAVPPPDFVTALLSGLPTLAESLARPVMFPPASAMIRQPCRRKVRGAAIPVPTDAGRITDLGIGFCASTAGDPFSM